MAAFVEGLIKSNAMAGEKPAFLPLASMMTV
jgi:hypothetical protein